MCLFHSRDKTEEGDIRGNKGCEISHIESISISQSDWVFDPIVDPTAVMRG